MENEYINQDTLKALLVRLANMYNSLNSVSSSYITYTAGDGILISDNTISLDTDYVNELIAQYLSDL